MLTCVHLRSLSSWTKEDAAEWVMTLGMIEPSINNVARDLSQEFVNQNVTGAKIAGGLLDRGALHFAFGLEVCMQTGTLAPGDAYMHAHSHETLICVHSRRLHAHPDLH